MSLPDDSKQLSVVCPVSNMAGRLERLQEWLEHIDFHSTQVIIVHDKRDENTGKELRSIISKINSPALIMQEGIFGTAAGARNAALSNCTGKWICFWDSDDQPNYHLILKGLDQFYDVIIGEFSIEMPTGSIAKVAHGSNAKQSLSRVSFNPGLWRMVFRAEVIKQLTFPEIEMGEDQCFLAQLDWNSLRTKFVDEVYYNYFSGWENQTTGAGKSRLPLVASMRFLQLQLKERKGKEEFIRNMASRQFFTLFKSRGIYPKLLSLNEFLKLFASPSGLLGQLKSLKEMSVYLIKSPRR